MVVTINLYKRFSTILQPINTFLNFEFVLICKKNNLVLQSLLLFINELIVWGEFLTNK